MNAYERAVMTIFVVQVTAYLVLRLALWVSNWLYVRRMRMQWIAEALERDGRRIMDYGHIGVGRWVGEDFHREYRDEGAGWED